MKRFLSSFYAKLTGLFLLLLVGLGVAVAVLSMRSAMRFFDESNQKLNRTLAADLVPRFEPLVRDSLHHQKIKATIHEMMTINPWIKIYLLDEKGRVKAQLGKPNREISQKQVDLEPIRRFARGGRLPILGTDPLHPGEKKPFSVAPTEAMGNTDCYLYIMLSSEQYASAAGMIDDSYIVRASLQGLGLILLLTALAGGGLFALLTRRLRAHQEVVEAFEDGDYERRIDVRSSDEIGDIAAAFNRTADTLTQNIEELQNADRMRRELIANASHDLRSPLASIQGYLETILIKSETLTPEARKRYVEVALKNTRMLSTLVGELFELSKLDAQQIEPQIEAFSLAELAQDVAMQFEPQAEKGDVHLETALPERSPLVRADIALVERALSNLIDNALCYTPAGGTVRVDLSVEDESATVHVTDTGPGIPSDELPHIFERFYRVEKSRDRDKGGTGLGLAIAQKIFELHGRTLTVESTMGEGTTFTFTLPNV